jgi:hypothetical protein
LVAKVPEHDASANVGRVYAQKQSVEKDASPSHATRG